jgi:hypothetical protein
MGKEVKGEGRERDPRILPSPLVLSVGKVSNSVVAQSAARALGNIGVPSPKLVPGSLLWYWPSEP